MGKILEYISRIDSGNKYICYKTRKLSLDSNDSDTIAYNYDDNPVVQTNKNIFAETDRSKQSTVSLRHLLSNAVSPSIFRYFLDGSRHTYKVDDIGIGKKIFPIVAGQVIVGCCERKDRDIFKKYDLRSKIVLAMPDDFDDNDDGENYCRSFCEKLNAEIQKLGFIQEREIEIEKLILYRTDGGNSEDKKDKNFFTNRAVSKIQTVMTDEEQLLVAKLCKENKLDDENWLIKDGSLEYDQKFSNIDPAQQSNLRANYQHVIGVSKMFNPDILLDFDKNPLSKTIVDLSPFERTKVYYYESEQTRTAFAVWYLRLRDKDFRETRFSDVVKCEMVLLKEGQLIDTDTINIISVNLIREAYPVCFGSDTRWANHLYPVFLTESFCKSQYIDSNVILSLF